MSYKNIVPKIKGIIAPKANILHLGLEVLLLSNLNKYKDKTKDIIPDNIKNPNDIVGLKACSAFITKAWYASIA